MRETLLIRLIYLHYPEPGHGKGKNQFLNIIKITKNANKSKSEKSPNFLT